MDGNYRSTRGKLLAGVCCVQAGVATAAAVATFVDVETILVFCPAIAFLGLVLAFASLQKTSINLLLFGLLCPVATSTIALLIASLNWSPDQATLPVRALLTLTAGVTVVWGALTGRQMTRPWSLDTSRREIGDTRLPQGHDSSAGKMTFRFSLLSLLGVLTFTCALFALLRQLAAEGEMMYFAMYGIGVLVLSLAVFGWFWYRVKCGVRERNHGRPTSPPPAIQNAS